MMTEMGIGHDQLVTTLAVPEMIEDAFVLHEPADEIEVAFAVLHTVFARFVDSGEVVMHFQAVDHLFQNLRHAEMREMRLRTLRVSSHSLGTISAW